MYADAVTFLFEKLFQLTQIYPSHCQTLASLAMKSLLFNGKMPGSSGKKLFLPFLDSSTYHLIAGKLIFRTVRLPSVPFSQTCRQVSTPPHPPTASQARPASQTIRCLLLLFLIRPRIFIRASVRPSVSQWLRWSVHPSHPSVCSSCSSLLKQACFLYALCLSLTFR